MCTWFNKLYCYLTNYNKILKHNILLQTLRNNNKIIISWKFIFYYTVLKVQNCVMFKGIYLICTNIYRQLSKDAMLGMINY